MDKKIIHFNNKKRLKLLFLGVAIMIFATVMLYLSLRSDVPRVAYILAFSGLSLASVTIIIIQILRIISKEQIGLEMDDSGFDFKGTSLGKTIGKVNWQDIRSIQTGTVYGSNQLFVKLMQPQSQANKINNPQMRKILIEKGLPINTDELNIDFHEMETYIMQYYHRYHS